MENTHIILTTHPAQEYPTPNPANRILPLSQIILRIFINEFFIIPQKNNLRIFYNTVNKLTILSG